MSKIEVLPCTEGDPGFVRLVEVVGDDLSIVRSARVSYNADWRSEIEEGETLPKDEKLINYLMANHHTSPFECVRFTFEVKAPIMVFRQWHRHRTWSYNEMSARYTKLDEGFYTPELDSITYQSEKNKQMRTKERHKDAEAIASEMTRICNEAFDTYEMFIREGVPRELARGILPVFTYSRMFGSVDLNNLFKFLELRLHEHAQPEITLYAKAILKLIQPVVPVATKAFLDHRILGKPGYSI